MKHLNWIMILIVSTLLFSCQDEKSPENQAQSKAIFSWNNATVYFLLTDRFNNGNPSNDGQHSPDAPPAPFRGFMGGDIKGVTEKIKDGYFDKLGVNAIWTTPVMQNISGSVDEGTGISYPFHGYWTRDWTQLDPRFATDEEYQEFVETAHAHGIRVIMDVIINHTGPVTPLDTKWPDSWVRTEPRCAYTSAESTISCTLVENLPDIKTESTEAVEIPPFLIEKWKKEGRYEKEIQELDDFFKSTNYPRRPYFYIIKWLVDYIKKYGIDGFRVDTAKHTEEVVWKDLKREAVKAFEQWKKENPDKVLDGAPFYMVGEVYNYYISGGRLYDYGDKKVDFFDEAFDALINFDFKEDAKKEEHEIFQKYNLLLHKELSGKTVLNYISSHDDGGPFDLDRKQPIEAGTKLLLTQGGAQIYYGDELARSLTVDAKGDATLRSFMNWDDLDQNASINGFQTKDILEHWQKLGSFRNKHIAIGAGLHQNITSDPYTFRRTYTENTTSNHNYSDKVIIGLDLPAGKKEIQNDETFEEGARLIDAYSGKKATVKKDKIIIDSPFDIVLLELEN